MGWASTGGAFMRRRHCKCNGMWRLGHHAVTFLAVEAATRSACLTFIAYFTGNRANWYSEDRKKLYRIPLFIVQLWRARRRQALLSAAASWNHMDHLCHLEFFTGLIKRTCRTFPRHLAVGAATSSARLTFIAYFTGLTNTPSHLLFFFLFLLPLLLYVILFGGRNFVSVLCFTFCFKLLLLSHEKQRCWTGAWTT